MVRGSDRPRMVAPTPPSDAPSPVPFRVEPRLTCAEQVRTDGQLLADGKAVVCVAVLRDQAVTVGVGTPRTPGSARRARARHLPVVRRSSGGTALLHAPGDLAWTIVLPRSDPRVGRDFARAYDRLGAGAVRFLRERHVAAHWVPSPELSLDYCLLGPRGFVLAVGDRILGGAAQHLTRDAFLHHGILPRTLDRPLLSQVFGLSEATGLSRLTSLEELGLHDPPEAQAEELAHALSKELGRS